MLPLLPAGLLLLRSRRRHQLPRRRRWLRGCCHLVRWPSDQSVHSYCMHNPSCHVAHLTAPLPPLDPSLQRQHRPPDHGRCRRRPLPSRPQPPCPGAVYGLERGTLAVWTCPRRARAQLRGMSVLPPPTPPLSLPDLPSPVPHPCSSTLLPPPRPTDTTIESLSWHAQLKAMACLIYTS